jgi:phosphoglycerate dehydrogenase-like enzyme
MKKDTELIVIGLGPVASSVVQPILGEKIRYIESPSEADFEIASGAIVRAAYVFDKSVFEKLPNLKVVARTGVGTDLVDLLEADRRKIPVTITPGSNTVAVAEGAIAHILHLVKRLGPLTKLVASEKFDERIKYPVGDLAGQTIGIVGYGRIGKQVAIFAKALGMKVIAFDPYSEIPSEITVSSFEELLAKSDVISLHIPLTNDTTSLINTETIAKMRDGVILVNCSRGALIELDAALIGLESQKIGGVGLDVFDPEPPKHHPIFDHENVVLTPHVMGLSIKSTLATLIDAAQAVRDVLEGKSPKSVANLK